MKSRWKITNTTIKPLKTNKKGQDIRPLRDRVGHAVQFADPSNQDSLIMVYPNRHVTVDEVSRGILNLYKKGLVGITEVGDITEELKKLATKPKSDPTEVPSVTPSTEPEMLIAEPAKEEAKDEGEMLKVEPPPAAEKPEEDLFGKATPMGESPDHEEKLVNPDGEPNFVAKAPKGGMKKKKKQSFLDD